MHYPAETDLIVTYLFNSSKCFAFYPRDADGKGPSPPFLSLPHRIDCTRPGARE
jgi:hypothetical protein